MSFFFWCLGLQIAQIPAMFDFWNIGFGTTRKLSSYSDSPPLLYPNMTFLAVFLNIKKSKTINVLFSEFLLLMEKPIGLFWRPSYTLLNIYMYPVGHYMPYYIDKITIHCLYHLISSKSGKTDRIHLEGSSGTVVL